MEEEIPRRLIDVEKLFADKNPGLLRIIPGFIIRYLKRITHQEEINGYIWRNRDLEGLPFVDAILKEFGVNIEVFVTATKTVSQEDDEIFTADGEENQWHSLHALFGGEHSLKDNFSIENKNQGKRFIVVANHPLGGLDGMALMQVIGRVRPDIVFPVNDLLMYVPGLKPLFIPINKHGRNTDNVTIINQTFESGKVILYFPAGLVSRKLKGGRISDLEWKKTIVTKARKYRRDIIPVYIAGRNSEWFYNLARLRKKLGIKANVEMLYLVDEMIRQKGKTIRLFFGNPVPYTKFTAEKTDQQWAESLRERVYAMEKKIKS